MLTRGNFTRDEWNHLLRLFHIRCFLATISVGFKNPTTMSKRLMQERKPAEGRMMAKSKPTMSLVSRSVNTVADAGFGCIIEPGEVRNAKSTIRSFRHRETDSAETKPTHRNKVDWMATSSRKSLRMYVKN